MRQCRGKSDWQPAISAGSREFRETRRRPVRQVPMERSALVHWLPEVEDGRGRHGRARPIKSWSGVSRCIFAQKSFWSLCILRNSWNCGSHHKHLCRTHAHLARPRGNRPPRLRAAPMGCDAGAHVRSSVSNYAEDMISQHPFRQRTSIRSGFKSRHCSVFRIPDAAGCSGPSMRLRQTPRKRGVGNAKSDQGVP
jgi:hypothetical protein